MDEIKKIVEEEVRKLNIQDSSVTKEIIQEIDKINEKMTEHDISIQSLPLPIITDLIRKIIEIILIKRELEEVVDMIILAYAGPLVT